VIGTAYLPNYDGVGWSGGQANGFGYAVSSAAPNKVAAFDFIKLAMDQQNLIESDNWCGIIPPAKVDATSPAFVNFASPYNALTANVLAKSVESPDSANYAVWVQGMMEATGAIVQKPSTTGAQAMAILKNYVTNQLGASAVATLK
jgi:ABC-type glycerol-3-phosphate transport system substrate-binding protein